MIIPLYMTLGCRNIVIRLLTVPIHQSLIIKFAGYALHGPLRTRREVSRTTGFADDVFHHLLHSRLELFFRSDLAPGKGRNPQLPAQSVAIGPYGQKRNHDHHLVRMHTHRTPQHELEEKPAFGHPLQLVVTETKDKRRIFAMLILATQDVIEKPGFPSCPVRFPHHPKVSQHGIVSTV